MNAELSSEGLEPTDSHSSSDSREDLRVFVKTMAGEMLDVEMQARSSVRDLKRRVQQMNAKLVAGRQELMIVHANCEAQPSYDVLDDKCELADCVCFFNH